MINDIHTKNTHNNEIKTILGYYSWPVGQLTKSQLVAMLISWR